MRGFTGDQPLSALFRRLERELRGCLDRTRGESPASLVRQFLNGHLPKHLTVGTGDVLDRDGTRSNRIDVVVANEDQPFRCGINQSNLFVIEGVVAAGEVRHALDAAGLDEAIDAGRRFKKLRNRYCTSDATFSNSSDVARFYECPPFFLIASELSMAVEPLLSRLAGATAQRSATGGGTALAPIDAVFVLGQGCAIDTGDGTGSVAYVRTVDGDRTVPVMGWVWQWTEQVLVDLLLWLGATMPRVRRLNSVAGYYLVESLRERHGVATGGTQPI